MEIGRFVALVALLNTPGLPADLAMRRISYSDAVTLFADKAMLKPRVEMTVRGGRSVRGKLVDASVDGFSLQRKPRTALCEIEHVRVLNARASRGRIFAGVSVGILAGFYASGAILYHAKPDSISLATLTVIAVPALGGWSGARIAERGQDMVYMLRQDRADPLCGDRRTGQEGDPPAAGATTPLLPPLQPLQP